ncbi:hypothetical protein BpHYR1_051304 [Brachionus plicatilis]|uniref:Uncharacterized protein n=1 Tax=Brachionus plicatilis TaxID=10195 RepID=A0A3M7T173_BRAPC|nr:hypothetical protein BpHYR1_051304 [Brachionus plicatilis]
MTPFLPETNISPLQRSNFQIEDMSTPISKILRSRGNTRDVVILSSANDSHISDAGHVPTDPKGNKTTATRRTCMISSIAIFCYHERLPGLLISEVGESQLTVTARLLDRKLTKMDQQKLMKMDQTMINLRHCHESENNQKNCLNLVERKASEYFDNHQKLFKKMERMEKYLECLPKILTCMASNQNPFFQKSTPEIVVPKNNFNEVMTESSSESDDEKDQDTQHRPYFKALLLRFINLEIPELSKNLGSKPAGKVFLVRRQGRLGRPSSKVGRVGLVGRVGTPKLPLAGRRYVFIRTVVVESPTRRLLYKQYDHFMIVDSILYRHSEDRYGFKATQLVLPKQIVERIVNQVHSAIYNVNEHVDVILLEDYDDIVEKNLPAVAINYLQKLKMKLKKCCQMATKIRNCRMDKAKLDNDRKIKKFEYNIGDYVLTDHPKLKKGLSHGLAHKYH